MFVKLTLCFSRAKSITSHKLDVDVVLYVDGDVLNIGVDMLYFYDDVLDIIYNTLNLSSYNKVLNSLISLHFTHHEDSLLHV